MLLGITHKHRRGIVNNSRARAEALPASSEVPVYLRCNRRSPGELSARPTTPGGTGWLDRSALSFGQKQEGLRRGALHHPSRHGDPLAKTGVGSGLHHILRLQGSNRASSDGPRRNRPGAGQGSHRARKAFDRGCAVTIRWAQPIRE